MSMINVALLQMDSCGTDQEANLVKGEMFCRKAREMGADVALFPEMWNIGYTFDHSAREGAPNHPSEQQSLGDLWRAPELWKDEDTFFDPVKQSALEAWQTQAIERDGEFVSHFRVLASELDMAIALTYLERWNGPPRDSVSLIDRRGEVVMTYAKIHTCDFDLPEAAITPGEDFYVCDLDTERGKVRIGAMICYDREFPESARMLKGAELILTPNACDLETNRLGQFRARAFENMVGVAMANYAAPQNNGHSVAYDPVIYDANGNARDALLIEAGENEGIYLAPFDMERIRDYRTRETWGNAFRRPQCYGLLTSREVDKPFIRVNASGEAYHRAKR
jgi:N-carbamoylputrescine amidase